MILIAISIGTASALITITLAGDVTVDPGNLLVVGPDGFDAVTEKARVSLGDSNHFIESEFGKGVTIGTFQKPNAIFVEEDTGNVEIAGGMKLSQDDASLVFGAPDGNFNNPMITMFDSGTSNDDRMVLGHSPDFEDLGLEYRDVGDDFVFTDGIDDEVIISLNDGNISTTGDVTCDNCILGFYLVTGDEDPFGNISTVFCDLGDKVTGGGGGSAGSLIVSLPITDEDPQGWTLGFTPSEPGRLAYALCADYAPAHVP